MIILKGGEFHDLYFGPMVDAVDGYTIKTGLVASAGLCSYQYGSNPVQYLGYAGTEVGGGWYKYQIGFGSNYGSYFVTFTTTGARPMQREVLWLPPSVYNALIAGTTSMDVNIQTIRSDANAALNLASALNGTGYNVGAGMIVVDNVSNPVQLADGGITPSKFGGGAYPLRSDDQGDTTILRRGSGTHTGQSLSAEIATRASDEDMQRVHDALITTTDNSVTGVVATAAHFARSGGSNWNSYFTKTSDPQVHQCGGYCYPGYQVAIYLTLDTPLTLADHPVPEAMLHMTASNGGGGSGFTVMLMNSLTPPLPATVRLNDIEGDCFSISSVTIPSANTEDTTYQIDVTSLVNDLLSGLGSGDSVSNLLFVIYPGDYYSATYWYAINGVNDPSLVIALEPTYEERPITAQQVRDAMMLAASAGTPAAESVDAKLDSILEDTETTLPALFAAGTGSGAVSFPVTINDEASNPIDGVEVWISTDSAGASVVAGTLSTDALGLATFMLDAGTYYLWRQKSGYNFTNPVTIVVS